MSDPVGHVSAWVAGWDFMAIFYSIIASLIVTAFLYWQGAFRWAYKKVKTLRGLKSYRRALEDDCKSLIVVGRRKGFTIDDVFISIDIARSDLMPNLPEPDERRPLTYVLVGGPGAGKSTIVKKRILEELPHSLPFLVRLREYSGFQGIEDYIIHKLSEFSVPDARLIFTNRLLQGECLCVLDGLDEVRPQQRKMVCDHIDHFYNKFFAQNPNRNKLIVTCRKEAYRDIPLGIPNIQEVRPLTDNMIQQFASKWPLEYPKGKSAASFWRDLAAMPKILEIARSPLLLVGGLMQYTESNLGIPEQRFEYLQTVARWLITDWATAQGHPPDPLRPVYSRILSKLAFYFHQKQISECSLAEVKEQIGKWLPEFGHTPEETDDIISSIATKTGICLRGSGSSFVFSQFGLQEYFASTEVLSRLDVTSFVKLDPKTWWREVILLAVAQERDPASILEALFEEDPVLAAAAVAECPTPALKMQEKAVQACMTAIDNNERAASTSIVTLLRRVRTDQERLLCQQLESRLDRNDEIAIQAGRILATAGTETATDTIIRHPGLWDQCLADTGFLSPVFENRLVDLVQRGPFHQARVAIDLIAKQLSEERRDQLTKLLPDLHAETANYLASVVLLNFEESEQYSYPLRIEGIEIVARCIGYVTDRNAYLKLRRTRLGPAVRYGFSGMGGAVLMCLFLDDHGNRNSEKSIQTILTRIVAWSKVRSRILCWTAATSVFSLLFIPVHSVLWGGGIVLLVVIGMAIYSLERPITVPPWLRMTLWGPGYDGFASKSLFVLTGSFALISLGWDLGDSTKASRMFLATLGTSVSLFLLGVIAASSSLYSWIESLREQAGREIRWYQIVLTSIYSAMLVFAIGSFVSGEGSRYWTMGLVGLGALFIGVALIVTSQHVYAWNKGAKASRLAQSATVNE